MSEQDPRTHGRNRLIGRALIIGLGLLLLVYILAMFLPRRA